MTQVYMNTSPIYRGIISNTPSGSVYYVIPNEILSADQNDVALLAQYGFTPAAPQVGAAAGVSSFNTRTGVVTLTAADIAALDLSGLPTSDPGSGKVWLNGNVLSVGTVTP
jgi:hypothetical protein